VAPSGDCKSLSPRLKRFDSVGRHQLQIYRYQINKAAIDGVRRLARWLGLKIEGMSDGQVRRLVKWRLAPIRTGNIYFS